MIQVLIYLVIISWAPLVYGTDVVKHCDMPGPNFRSLSLPSPETCKDACQDDLQCAAFSFISGWNRCFLKAKPAKHVKLRIVSAVVEMKDGQRQIAEPEYDHDIPGKDLRKVTDIATAPECGQRCLADATCVAYAYLEGYRDCWLKDRLTRKQGKIFYCGDVR